MQRFIALWAQYNFLEWKVVCLRTSFIGTIRVFIHDKFQLGVCIVNNELTSISAVKQIDVY